MPSESRPSDFSYFWFQRTHLIMFWKIVVPCVGGLAFVWLMKDMNHVGQEVPSPTCGKKRKTRKKA